MFFLKIHWPVRMKKGSVGVSPENFLPVDIPSTWKSMEALYDSGKARAIGVSNFSTKKLGNLLDLARVPPSVNQVECHPSWRQAKLREFCKSKGVHLSVSITYLTNLMCISMCVLPYKLFGYYCKAYFPLGSPGWFKSDVLKNPILNMVAERLGKSPAQVALRWGIQLGNSVLPKSTNEGRIRENLDVFDWSIPDDLFAKFFDIEQVGLKSTCHFSQFITQKLCFSSRSRIKSLCILDSMQARLLNASVFAHETLSPYKSVEELWDGEV